MEPLRHCFRGVDTGLMGLEKRVVWMGGGEVAPSAGEHTPERLAQIALETLKSNISIELQKQLLARMPADSELGKNVKFETKGTSFQVKLYGEAIDISPAGNNEWQIAVGNTTLKSNLLDLAYMAAGILVLGQNIRRMTADKPLSISNLDNSLTISQISGTQLSLLKVSTPWHSFNNIQYKVDSIKINDFKTFLQEWVKNIPSTQTAAPAEATPAPEVVPAVPAAAPAPEPAVTAPTALEALTLDALPAILTGPNGSLTMAAGVFGALGAVKEALQVEGSPLRGKNIATIKPQLAQAIFEAGRAVKATYGKEAFEKVGKFAIQIEVGDAGVCKVKLDFNILDPKIVIDPHVLEMMKGFGKTLEEEQENILLRKEFKIPESLKDYVPDGFLSLARTLDDAVRADVDPKDDSWFSSWVTRPLQKIGLWFFKLFGIERTSRPPEAGSVHEMPVLHWFSGADAIDTIVDSQTKILKHAGVSFEKRHAFTNGKEVRITLPPGGKFEFPAGNRTSGVTVQMGFEGQTTRFADLSPNYVNGAEAFENRTGLNQVYVFKKGSDAFTIPTGSKLYRRGGGEIKVEEVGN